MTTPQTSDWITRSRRLYGQALDLFADYQRLEFEARLTGRVVFDPATGKVTSSLTPDDFAGENAGVDAQQFTEAFVTLGLAFGAVEDDETVALLLTRS